MEDRNLFAQALELGQRLADEGGVAEFSRAATVADGLEIAGRDGPFDLAVVDVMLPDGNGADLVREVKAAYPQTRVAVLSGVPDLSGSLEAGRTRRKASRSPCRRSSPTWRRWPARQPGAARIRSTLLPR